MIQEIFPIPLYVNEPKIEEIFLVQKEIDDVIDDIFQGLERPPARDTNLKSNIHKTKNLIADYNLNNLAEYILKHTKKYIQNTEAFVRDECHLELSGSWMNVYDTGDAQEWHCHGDAFISGCYYYRANGINGDISFRSSCPHMRAGDFPNGNFYKTNLNYAPCNGVLLLFPGWLEHKVQVNETDERRVCIAFDLFLNNPNSQEKHTLKI